jgi:hypothetical protein
MKRTSTTPDWQQANGPSIQRALARAQGKPHGGWFVLGASRMLARSARKRPQSHQVDGVELVSWSSRGGVAVAPAACPHLGAHLGGGQVDQSGHLCCPWHGLTLPGDPTVHLDGQGRWSAFPVHDDGVLTWVQLTPGADAALATPIVTKRPDRFFDAVIRRELVAEPADVIANRLDPWHGVHFHPYAFARLEVVEATDDALDLRVAYRVTPRHVIEVDARFDCPDPRTIVMTITAGEGTGSVVETHATPIVRAAPGVAPRTAMIEATLATSDRPGFSSLLRGAAVARPMIAAMAGRLWRDDARYAERTYALRSRGWRPGDH